MGKDKAFDKNTPIAICNNLVDKAGFLAKVPCGQVISLKNLKARGYECPTCGHNDKGRWRPSKASTIFAKEVTS